MDDRGRTVSAGTGLAVFRHQVRDEWVDYNGHLSEAYYVLAFGFATDAVMDQVGLDAAYRDRTGCSLYTVEAHIRYLREVPAGSELVITSRVVSSAAKKLRLCHEMTVAGDLVATEEILALHVATRQGRSTRLPEQVLCRLGELAGDTPVYAGRAVGSSSGGR